MTTTTTSQLLRVCLAAAAASRAALMAESLAPGLDAPNFFQIKVVGTEFCIPVGRPTTLLD